MKHIVASLAVLIALSAQASAHGQRHHAARSHETRWWQDGERWVPRSARPMNPVAQSLGMGLAVMLERSQENAGQRFARRVIESASQILPHPSGCPRTAFCGCGAATYLGIAQRDLWLASNWFRFPRSTPGPGMAAVRRHHVMVIVSYGGGDRATVYDANSGRHLTRLHEVSLRGYTVVNPRGGRA